MGGQLIRDERRRARRQHVATADVDLVGEQQRHRLTGRRTILCRLRRLRFRRHE